MRTAPISNIGQESVEMCYLLQAFSSDWSLHSNLSLQKSSLSIHSPLPQDSFPSGHTGSSVLKMGSTFLGSADQHRVAVFCICASQLF